MENQYDTNPLNISRFLGENTMTTHHYCKYIKRANGTRYTLVCKFCGTVKQPITKPSRQQKAITNFSDMQPHQIKAWAYTSGLVED